MLEILETHATTPPEAHFAPFEPGDYLEFYMQGMQERIRFLGDGEYPNDIFMRKDDVLAHTHRCTEIACDIAQAASPGMIDTDLLLRLVRIHDIPELITGDHPVFCTNEVKDEVEIEKIAAAELLTEEDYQLYIDFKAAELFLRDRQRTVSPFPSPEALIAKTVDLLDDNSRFFTILRQHRLLHPQDERISVLFEKGMEYVLKESEKYITGLEKFELLLDVLHPEMDKHLRAKYSYTADLITEVLQTYIHMPK